MEIREVAKPNGIAPESLPPTLAPDESTLRFVALRQVERVRNFKMHVGAFVVGIILVSGIWALTEYQNAGGWPERLNDDGGPGSWNPWILWVLLGWGVIVAGHGLITYFRRATTEDELQREIARLKGS